jgi:hypothetical protein
MATYFQSGFEAFGFPEFNNGQTGGGGSVTIDRHADAAFNSAFGMRITCTSGTAQTYYAHEYDERVSETGPLTGQRLAMIYIHPATLAGAAGMTFISFVNSSDDTIAALNIIPDDGQVWLGSDAILPDVVFGTLAGDGINQSGWHFLELQCSESGEDLLCELFINGVSVGSTTTYTGETATSSIRCGAVDKPSGITGALHLDGLAVTNQTQAGRRLAIDQAFSMN